MRGARRDNAGPAGRWSDPRASNARPTEARIGERRDGDARTGDGRPAGRLPRRPGGAAAAGAGAAAAGSAGAGAAAAGSAGAGAAAAGAAGAGAAAAGSAASADERRRTSPDAPDRDSTRAMPQEDAPGRDSTRAMPQEGAPRQGGRRRVIGGAAAAGAAGAAASGHARAAGVGPNVRDIDAQRGPHRDLRPGGPHGPAEASGPVGQGGPGAQGGPGGPGDSGEEPPRPRGRFGRGKKIVAGVLVLLLLWVGGLVWAGMSAWGKVQKVDAIPSEHLADSGAGHNTLIVGSDGRSGLTTEQKKKLGTGDAEGQRTDSIMILHTGGDKPTLMSIPRDSYVSIPGHAKNKINASFSIGGPQLLVKTIETNTGIHIDNYMEIGFGGFASVVDAVGGVNICVARDMDDPKAHINLKKGCQQMDGPTALGYVRARYSDPEGDLGRAKRQRQFLAALMKEISSPSNLLVPWRLKGLGESGAQGLTVDKGMSMMQGLRTMWNLKKFSGDGGNSVVVPIGNAALPTPAGEAVEWDATRSAELFKAIKENGDTSSFVKKTTAN